MVIITSVMAVVMFVAAASRVTTADAGEDALARVNAILQNSSVPQQYKNMLRQSLRRDFGVTFLESGEIGAAARPTAHSTEEGQTKCGAWCCGVTLTPRQVGYTKMRKSTCYHQELQYYKYKCKWIGPKCTGTKHEIKSFDCYISDTVYKTEIPECKPHQYTTCCTDHVLIGDCCTSIDGINAITRFIESLIKCSSEPRGICSLFGGLFGGK